MYEKYSNGRATRQVHYRAATHEDYAVNLALAYAIETIRRLPCPWQDETAQLAMIDLLGERVGELAARRIRLRIRWNLEERGAGVIAASSFASTQRELGGAAQHS